MRARVLVSLCVVLLASGCEALDKPAPLPELDEAYFRCNVQPVLTKSCAAFVCHGDAKRYFKVFARNRLRLGGTEDERNAFMRETERAYDFNAARAQVDLTDPDKSLLLLKPLDEAAGGYYHGGAIEFEKGDVFLARDEPDFGILEAWVKGATDDPACIEPGSNL